MEKQKCPELRFNGFSGDWKKRKLSEIATMYARIGWQNLRTSEFLDRGDYMLITGTDFDDGQINYSTCHYVAKDRYEQDRYIQIRNGNILITKDGTLGKVAYVQGLSMPATLNAGVFNVEIKDTSTVNELYLFQYLKAPFLMNYVDKRATGGTIKHLNQNILVDFPVVMPTEAEQTQIGKFFQNLDKSIALQEKKLAQTQNLKKAMLEKMFPKAGSTQPEIRLKGFSGDWEENILKELSSVQMCKRIFKSETKEKGEIPFYKIGTFGGIPDAFISKVLYDEYQQKYPYPEVLDILISASGTIGRTVIYNGEKAYYQDSNIIWLKIDKSKLSNKFLVYFYEIAKWNNIEGSTIKRLYNSDILSTVIRFPCLKEQNAIGNFFKQLDETLALQQQQLQTLKNLKQAFLEKMFV